MNAIQPNQGNLLVINDPPSRQSNRDALRLLATVCSLAAIGALLASPFVEHSERSSLLSAAGFAGISVFCCLVAVGESLCFRTFSRDIRPGGGIHDVIKSALLISLVECIVERVDQCCDRRLLREYFHLNPADPD
jgi:hypothetical protein